MSAAVGLVVVSTAKRTKRCLYLQSAKWSSIKPHSTDSVINEMGQVVVIGQFMGEKPAERIAWRQIKNGIPEYDHEYYLVEITDC